MSLSIRQLTHLSREKSYSRGVSPRRTKFETQAIDFEFGYEDRTSGQVRVEIGACYVVGMIVV
jgi:hypothetical protein